MAEELDRVRVSAAELRAEASNLIDTGDQREEEQQQHREQWQQRRHEVKRPDLQRYQPMAGHGHCHHESEEGQSPPLTHCEDPAALTPDSHECVQLVQFENKAVSDRVSERHGSTDGGIGTDRGEEDRFSGDGDNGLNCRKGSVNARNNSQDKVEGGYGRDCEENDRDHQEPAGAPKQTRRARKPDREFYQPGGRRNVQGKESRTGREQGRTTPKMNEPKMELESQNGAPTQEGNKNVTALKEGVKNRKEKVKGERTGETNRKSGRRDAEKKVLSSDAGAENLTSKIGKLSVKEEVPVGDGDQAGEEVGGRRRRATGEGKRGQAGGVGANEVGEKRERGKRRKKGTEREREGNQDSRKGRAEADRDGVAEGRSEHRVTPKNKSVSESNRQKDPDKTGERREGKSKEKERERESQRRNGNNNHRPQNGGRSMEPNRNGVWAAEGCESNQPDIQTLSSKRYSKSDIRRSRNRNRTYSSSSASSATSLDNPMPRLDKDQWQSPGCRDMARGRTSGGVVGGLQSWTTNGESSTESLEGSEMSDTLEDRRRRRDDEEDLAVETQTEEKNRQKGHKGGARGILRVSLDKQPCTSHSTSALDEYAKHHKHSSDPRGRGRGILVLPAHTDLSNSPESGPRLLFGGNRGGGAGRGRGGRGGGVRRLWDPNNPDQKPALTRSQPSQHSSLQQPMYLQVGGGSGQLHFLDTDDEVVGSPPVHQGEYFSTQQHAAAIAYYKFQNSDNPYSYPMATSNPHNSNANTNQRYPYPYHVGPYQMAPTNSMYPSSGMGQQFCAGYRGSGYPQPGAGGGMTPEEMEQQARGELGRLLRAADTQELQLSNLLSRDKLSADGLDRMAQLRADLLTLYEQVILTDIEFSDSQNLDQALWKNVFYQVIERFRQLLKDPGMENTPRIRNMLLTLLDEGAVFFEKLLQKLQTVFQFKLEDYMDGMAIRVRPLRKTVKYALISAQRCMICQGDIARYREQASNSANYGKARSWYLKAQQIAPKNGRPYNQLALLAVYTKRKLDAVYYYMRSLAASNPILTAKESLMSLFEEAKRKADQLERRKRQETEGGSRGPAVRGRGRGEEGARVEIWIRPSGHVVNPSSHRGGSESSRDSEQDGELCSLSASDLNKRFILSFLHSHGKLYTKVGMESFPGVARRVLQELRALLQHSPCPLGSTRLLQIITINMFTIHNAHSREGDGEVRSALQEQTTALGLAVFALLVQRCTDLLREMPTEPIAIEDGEDVGKGEELEGMVRVSAFLLDLRELLPSIKVWSDWMLGHPDEWNPPPCSIDCSPDVWQCLADLCNVLARVDHAEVPLYKADTEEGDGDEELSLLLLEEDRLLAGFVPLLAAPQEPCYIDKHTDMAIAADCKRVTVLKYFLEALCGQEEPLLAFKGGKYVSMATSPLPNHLPDGRNRKDSHTEKEGDDVIVEAESDSLSVSEGDVDVEDEGDSENDIKELRARRHALTNKLAQQQRRRDKIQAVLQTGSQLELEVRPLFLVPDTNGFIDHLDGLKKLLQTGSYILVVPLIVITELDGLAKGQDSFGGGGGGMGTGGRGSRSNSSTSGAHARAVQEKARLAVAFLERGFEAREPRLRALTSRGNQLESIAFRSEDTSGQQGNNDDVILSCCLHYCNDKAKDFMPDQRNGPVRLRREVVLLTDDRNLRVKALTRNVPVRDIPAFLSWAKVG
ncbi:telomerase-binding protein EST1A isoform X2 [Lampris incognitus]|uniref:telomerase-binding protein EST1A isoform X2 n=1 Tax=Lampris incognitus TaxID=2546036 RepID=UPI0024B592D4|nr:telomerase-binding protein EST1A isoform X2 [Lampris incognitus]